MRRSVFLTTSIVSFFAVFYGNWIAHLDTAFDTTFVAYGATSTCSTNAPVLWSNSVFGERGFKRAGFNRDRKRFQFVQ